MVEIGYQKEQIIERLKFDNPWWANGKIDKYYDEMPRRMYQEKFHALVADWSLHRSLILMGPRRVGKTVLIFHTIQELIQQGVNPQKIRFCPEHNT